MRKVLNVLMMVMIFASAAAFAAETTDPWSINLSFSTSGASDVMEVTIGEGDASEMLKPPPLPGQLVTGDPADAIINAYAYVRSTQRKVAKSILAPDAESTARVWEIQVEAEETGSVYVTPDLTNKSADANVKYLLIDSETGVARNLVDDLVDGKVEAYSSTGVTKTLYAMAGTSETYAIVDPSGSVIGQAPSREIDNLTDFSGVDVYVNGSKIGSTDTEGGFTVSGLAAMSGSQTVMLDGEYMLPSKAMADVTDGVTIFTLKNVRRCDFNNDNTICDFDDFKILKKAYKKRDGEGKDPITGFEYDADADANGDGYIDFSDFKVLKKYYKQTAD